MGGGPWTTKPAWRSGHVAAVEPGAVVEAAAGLGVEGADGPG